MLKEFDRLRLKPGTVRWQLATDWKSGTKEAVSVWLDDPLMPRRRGRVVTCAET